MPADVAALMAEMEALGTEQNRKVYARHGITPPLFGLSYAHLGKLTKRLKTDHDLALALWRTGNHDARVLATMIADPEKVTAQTAEDWVRTSANYAIVDAACRPIGASPVARQKAEEWMTSDDEWVGMAGWNLLAILTNDESIPDSYFEPSIDTIERDIHGKKNRVRYAMNNALICIGIRSEALRKKAVAAAKRIGEVHVDHGETGCKTPDAATYVEKTVAYRKERAALKSAAPGTSATAAAKVATAPKATSAPRLGTYLVSSGTKKKVPQRADIQHKVYKPSAKAAVKPAAVGGKAAAAKGGSSKQEAAAKKAASVPKSEAARAGRKAAAAAAAGSDATSGAKQPKTRAANVMHKIRKPRRGAATEQTRAAKGGTVKAAPKKAAAKKATPKKAAPKKK